MKAIVFESFGNSSVLQLKNVEKPHAQPGEVLIKISHTSVNPVDWKIREGYLKTMFPHVFPVIPGWDVSGTIAELGQGVTRFSVGDSVYAYARLPTVHSGTYTEWVSLPEDFVSRAPTNIAPFQAASVPLAALTAYQALFEVAKVKSGDQVLVTAGAGGVGSFAIQFAKIAGATVATTTSTKNHHYVTELGADQIIDYTLDDLQSASRKIAPKGFDIIFDAVGGDTLSQVAKLLSPNGRLVSIVDTPEKGSFHFVYPSGKQLEDIAKLFETKQLKLPAIQVHNIKNAASAMDLSQSGRVRGKIVLENDFGKEQ